LLGCNLKKRHQLWAQRHHDHKIHDVG
jgi:hypothetical protein